MQRKAKFLRIFLITSLFALTLSLVGTNTALGQTPPQTTYLPLVMHNCGGLISLEYPSDKSVLDSILPEFKWQINAPPNVMVNIQVARDPGFPQDNLTKNLLTTVSITEHRFSVNLATDTTYYWRASILCSNQPMITTPVWSFTTPATVTKPAPPSLTSPANNSIVSNELEDFKWEAVAGATGYFLTLKNINTNTTGFIESTLPIVTLKLTPGDYQWSVKAYNAEAAGDPSPTWSFSTASTLTRQAPMAGLNGQSYVEEDGQRIYFLERK